MVRATSEHFPHGRVVFYDYDELCLLSECNFRTIPESDQYEDEIALQPWFSVGPNDILPYPAHRRLANRQTHIV